MESFFSRYRNASVLVALLLVQVIALATQVKRADPSHPDSGRSVPLLRYWMVSIITPPEQGLIHAGEAVRSVWHSYFDLRRVNQTNAELQEEINRLRMDQVRWREQAHEARRLEALLSFKERYATQTVAAQVVGSSGTDASHIVYIDKGEDYQLKPDLPVITPDGIVGKVREVYPHSSQVLLLNDQQSGVGVILEKSRRQGIMKGSNSGELEIHYIMSDEKIEPGEKVYTSGGDRIFPKGLEVGEVTGVLPDPERDGFQLIRVKPNANLFRLEEVLVVTKVDEAVPTEQDESPAQMLATRLPGADLQQPATTNALPPDSVTPGAKPLKPLQPDRFTPPNELAGTSLESRHEPLAAGAATANGLTRKDAQATANKKAIAIAKPQTKTAAAVNAPAAAPDAQHPPHERD